MDQASPWAIHADVGNVDGYQVKMCASCLTTGTDGIEERLDLDSFMITQLEPQECDQIFTPPIV